MHYADKPMQYTVIFHSFKNDNLKMKNCDNFHIFAQNKDCKLHYALNNKRSGNVKTMYRS